MFKLGETVKIKSNLSGIVNPEDLVCLSSRMISLEGRTAKITRINSFSDPIMEATYNLDVDGSLWEWPEKFLMKADNEEKKIY